MITEKSCGCIILKAGQVLLISARNDDGELFWSFPKGHQEPGETDIQTAVRETKEEIGIDVKIIDQTPIKAGHFIHNHTAYKEIILFIAKPTSNNLKLQSDEVEIAQWILLKDTGDYLRDCYHDIWLELTKRETPFRLSLITKL